MSVVWAAVYAALFVRRGWVVAVACGIAVFSHFVLDFLMHPGDLALWPPSPAHVGLGLRTALPRGWWFVELAFVAACCAYYFTRVRTLGTFGGRAWAVVLVVVALHLANAPWLAPAG